MSRILVISPIPSHPPNTGNRTRILHLLEQLQQHGHDIYFLYAARQQQADTDAMSQAWKGFYHMAYRRPKGCSYWIRQIANMKKRIWPHSIRPWKIDDWYDPNIDQAVAEVQRTTHFDVVIAEYVFFSKALKCFHDDALKIIDTHDVFTDRHRLYEQQGETPGFFYTTRRQEQIGLQRADVILAIQERERQYFSQLVNKPVITVGHPIRLHPPQSKGQKRGKRLLFVGSCNIPNIRSMEFFLRDVFPQLRQRYADLCLEIVGNLYTGPYSQLAKQLPKGCVYCGEIADLSGHYHRADVVINPITLATGLSIKLVEALGYAKPVVTTTRGGQGICHQGNGRPFRVADTPDEFIQAISGLLDAPEQRQELAQCAYEFATQYRQRCLDPLLKLLANPTPLLAEKGDLQ